MDQLIDAKTIGDVIAGGLGGAVHWASVPLPWRQGLLSIFVGSVCAVYLSDIGVSMISAALKPILPSDVVVNGHLAGFVIGTSGILITTFIVQFVRHRLGAINKSDDGKTTP